jgi:chromate reductase
MRIIGLAGSTRQGSWNLQLLEAASEFIPSWIEYQIISNLGELPFYSEELERQLPQRVDSLRKEVGRADAVLIATPEYNHSFSAVIKNALDWLSRPSGASVLSSKPVAIMGASPSQFGTVRAQAQLRQVLFAVDAAIIQRPEVIVSNAPSRFDPEGNLIDPDTRSFLAGLVGNLISKASNGDSSRVA